MTDTPDPEQVKASLTTLLGEVSPLEWLDGTPQELAEAFTEPPSLVADLLNDLDELEARWFRRGCGWLDYRLTLGAWLKNDAGAVANYLVRNNPEQAAMVSARATEISRQIVALLQGESMPVEVLLVGHEYFRIYVQWALYRQREEANDRENGENDEPKDPIS